MGDSGTHTRPFVTTGRYPEPTPDRCAEGEREAGAVISQQELEKRLWDAANALRGPVDPGDFKNYVFPVLFWKWLSDTHIYERAQAMAEFGSEVDPEVEADFHRFALPAGASWGEVTTTTANLGHAIQTAFSRIQQANPETLAGVFGDAAWGNKERLPEASLVNLLNAFQGLTLDPGHVSNDLLGGAYEYMLRMFAEASGSKAGEFFTPRAVVRLIVRILDPRPGEEIVDPACGSGGMLVETINTVRDHSGDTRTLRLYGQEQNLTTAGIARMNLFLHDIEDFQIVRGDTLREPALREPSGRVKRFDVVIANPPFSLKNWGYETWAADPRAFCGLPPKNVADMAWIQHMITSMKDMTGRVGVVMPHGVLFRGGAEGAIRRCLVEKDLLEAVIGLPPNLFYSTTIPACILVFRATKPKERAGHVLFVDGSSRFAKGKNQNTMSDADSIAIHHAYCSGDDPDGEGGVNVRLVPFAEIETNGFDLNIGRYLKTTAADETDLPSALLSYEEAREARIASEKDMFHRLAAAGIADLGDGDE